MDATLPTRIAYHGTEMETAMQSRDGKDAKSHGDVADRLAAWRERIEALKAIQAEREKRHERWGRWFPPLKLWFALPRAMTL